MIEKVKLRIETPDSNCLELEANGVIIPAAQGDITILSERAPSVFSLDYGVVQLLNADLKVKDKYYITSGAADVANGVIKLMTGRILHADKISKDEALAKAESDVFYRMIADKLENKTEKYC